MSDKSTSSAQTRIIWSARELLENKEEVAGFPHPDRWSERTPYNWSFSPLSHNLMLTNSYVLSDLTDLDPRGRKKAATKDDYCSKAVFIHAHIYMHICVYIYTHICVYIYTHTHFKKAYFCLQSPKHWGLFWLDSFTFICFSQTGVPKNHLFKMVLLPISELTQ